LAALTGSSVFFWSAGDAVLAGCGAEGAFGSLPSAGGCCAWSAETAASKKNAPAIAYRVRFRMRKRFVLSIRILEGEIVGKPSRVVKEERRFRREFFL
jgi:hypothetical protein